jgi:hypothetical protein
MAMPVFCPAAGLDIFISIRPSKSAADAGAVAGPSVIKNAAARAASGLVGLLYVCIGRKFMVLEF